MQQAIEVLQQDINDLEYLLYRHADICRFCDFAEALEDVDDDGEKYYEYYCKIYDFDENKCDQIKIHNAIENMKKQDVSKIVQELGKIFKKIS